MTNVIRSKHLNFMCFYIHVCTNVNSKSLPYRMPLTRRQMLQRQRNTIQSFKEKMQDMREFLHGLDSFTQGQVKVKEVDWQQLQYIILGVTPNAGPYRGGEYPFKV